MLTRSKVLINPGVSQAIKSGRGVGASEDLFFSFAGWTPA